MELSFKLAQGRFNTTSADKIVLELLSATKGFTSAGLSDLSAKQLLCICSHLNLSEPSVRMALSRQTKNGKLKRKSGRYSLTKSTRPFPTPRFWLDINHRLKPWSGEWLLVSLADQKVNATVMRRLQRKASLLGMHWIPGLGWIRPDNLHDLQQEVAINFAAILEQHEFYCAKMHSFSENWLANIVDQWQTTKLDQFYSQALRVMNEEEALLAGLDHEQILIRSFIIGRMLVEMLCEDPWLPAEMVNHSARSKLFDVGVEYYKLIMPAWFSVLEGVR